MTDTKQRADISEYAVVTRLLERGHKVLRPVGDRLPYDLAVDRAGRLIRVQVKRAWRRGDRHIVDVRRTRTNRRRMVRVSYRSSDFDVAIIHLPDAGIFYVMPFEVFAAYKSEITMSEISGRQRQPRSYAYREAWEFLEA